MLHTWSQSSTVACHTAQHINSIGFRAGFSAHRRVHRRADAQNAVCRAVASHNNQLALFSPSKINLFLRVVRRREDGYHDLASLFHVIDLGDDMEFELLPEGATKDELRCSDPTIPSDDSNLVIKALNLFRRKTGCASFLRVSLVKKVPHGAGLGGGSGNAATTLWAVNELMGRPASNAQLLEWSGEIGSDISVFFSLGAAYCTGRGEIVEDVAPPLPLTTPLLLVKPPVGLATPRIFKSLDLARRSTADPLQLLAGMAQAGAAGTGLPQALCVNDLEQPAFDNLPELAALKQQLAQEAAAAHQSNAAASPPSHSQPPAVFMTGSGSTLVTVGSDRVPAFLADPQYKELFVSPARLVTRQQGQWYSHSGQWSRKA